MASFGFCAPARPGGVTCKIRLLCDAQGQPLHFRLTAGQIHESTVWDDVLIGADRQLIDAEGEAVAWPVALAGDKGYGADRIDACLPALGIEPVSPCQANDDRDTRVVTFDREAYRDRNIIERLIGWLKECRHVSSRFEKTAKNFGGIVRMTFIQRYLRLIG